MQPERTSFRMSFDEYLRLEQQSEIRHEFYDGEVIAMAGGTVNHNRLTRRVSNLLEGQPLSSRCEIFSENMKVEVRAGGHMPYPDVVLTCHPFDLRGNNQVIRQPRLIVEVLSKSTEKRDRSEKWRDYRKMPSLWYYMLVDQYRIMVELFSRIEQTDEWINTVHESLDDVVVLPRLNAELTLNAIYDGIDLLPEDEETDELVLDT